MPESNHRSLTLTSKQARFVAEYLLDSNANQAAIAMWYVPRETRVRQLGDRSSRLV